MAFQKREAFWERSLREFDEACEALELKHQFRRATEQAQAEASARRHAAAEVARQAYAPASAQAAAQPDPEWVMFQTPRGKQDYHNFRSGQTVWTLPSGARARDAYGSFAAATAQQQNRDQAWQFAQAAASSAPAAAYQQHQPQVRAGRGTVCESHAGVGPQQKAYAAASTRAAAQPDTEWMMYRTPSGTPYYHNLLNGQTVWTLAYGVRAIDASGACAAPQQQQHGVQAAAASAQPCGYQQSQPHMRAGHRAAGGGQAGIGPEQKVLVLDPVQPPSLNKKAEDNCVYAYKKNILEAMTVMLHNRDTVARRKKAFRHWQITWHPDRNIDKEDIATSVFQFVESAREWFLNDVAHTQD